MERDIVSEMFPGPGQDVFRDDICQALLKKTVPESFVYGGFHVLETGAFQKIQLGIPVGPKIGRHVFTAV
jgi:hypothetical protein